MKRLEKLRAKLDVHKKAIAAELQKHLDDSLKEIVDYYLQRVVESPPAALLGQITSGKPSKDQARRWLEYELLTVFPKAESLIGEMALDVAFKDLTFETLNHEDFFELVKEKFPDQKLDKPFEDFRAAGQSVQEGGEKN